MLTMQGRPCSRQDEGMHVPIAEPHAADPCKMLRRRQSYRPIDAARSPTDQIPAARGSVSETRAQDWGDRERRSLRSLTVAKHTEIKQMAKSR